MSIFMKKGRRYDIIYLYILENILMIRAFVISHHVKHVWNLAPEAAIDK